MLSLLTLSLIIPTISAPSPAPQHDNPPIRVSLSDERVRRGERINVKVKVAEDGYLLVLRLDGDGRTRVIFPIDPGDNMAIKGGHDLEIRGRGGRESFQADERDGVGVVVAARSTQPFRFDGFVKHGRWDYAALAVPRDSNVAPDAALLDLIDKMTAPEQHYAYDVASYGVNVSPRAYSGGYYSGHGAYYTGWRIAPRYYPSSCFDWYCEPWYGPRVGIGFRTTFYSAPRYYSRPAIGIGVRFGGRRRW